jgi:hypothetical protein
LFKEKHASKCEELDVLRVEVAELKSRSAFLGACTSCPVLHAKIDEMHAYTSSLEAKLKEPIPTSWLSGHEPQLRMMIEAFKRQDGEGLGANRVGEGSGENIPEPLKPTTKMIFPQNLTILGTD